MTQRLQHETSHVVIRRCLALCTSMAGTQLHLSAATAEPLPHSSPAHPRPAGQASKPAQGQQEAPAAAASAQQPDLNEPGRHQQLAEQQQAEQQQTRLPEAEYDGPSWAAVHSLMTSSSQMAVRSEALLLLGYAARQAVAEDCSVPAAAPVTGHAHATPVPSEAEQRQLRSVALQPGQPEDSTYSSPTDRQGAAGPASASVVLVQHLQLCSQPDELEDMRLVSAEALAASGQPSCTARDVVSKGIRAAIFFAYHCSSVGVSVPARQVIASCQIPSDLWQVLEKGWKVQTGLSIGPDSPS